MGIVISPIFFLLCFSCLALATNISIGGITNPSTRIGREQKVALELASKNFADSDLQLNTTDLNGTDTRQSNSIAQHFIRLGAKVIITIGTLQQVTVAGIATSESKIPSVSLMPSPFVAGPFTFRVSYSNYAFVRCIADFIKLHGWRNVITIYEDDALGSVSNTSLLLDDALSASGSYVQHQMVFPSMKSPSDLEKLVEAELQSIMRYISRVFIVLQSSEGLALSLFKKAKELHMLNPHYVWICGSDITDLLNSTLTSDYIEKYMQGVIGIKPYINESADGYHEFFSNFQSNYSTYYRKQNESFFNPGVYAVRAYDALNAILLASYKSKTSNISFANALSMVSFDGLSGTIVLKNSTLNSNETKSSVYQIFGIVGSRSTDLGLWYNSGFDSSMKNISWLYKRNEKYSFNPGGLRKLRVGIPARPFWGNFVEVDSDSTINCNATVKNVSGYCIDVFEAALALLKYNLSYEFIAYTTENNSTCKVQTYDHFPNLVNSQEVDFVVGDVTILSERMKNASFTQPFMTSELVMVIPMKETDVGWLSTKPFSRDLWICILFIVCFYVLLVWLLEGNHEDADPDFRGPLWKQFLASFWIICHSIFLKIDEGVGGYHTKLVLLWWFLLVQVLISSYTASLSSIFITEKLNPKVDDIKVGYNADSFVRGYLLSNFNYKPDNLTEMKKPEDFSAAFQTGNITVAYLELPYFIVFKKNHSNYSAYGESRSLGGFGFVFPKGSPLRDDFSIAILKLEEDGTMLRLQDKWNLSSSNSTHSATTTENSVLGLANFEYLFLSTTCFAVLTVLHKFHQQLVVFTRAQMGRWCHLHED